MPEDRLEALLTDYERRKQEETRHQVQRALRLEEARKRGADHLRQYALESAREVANRLQAAGHKVLHQELLDAYPPNVRIHLWVKQGPLDAGEPKRTTFELVWGDPEADTLFAKRWTPDGVRIQGSARPRGPGYRSAVLFSHDEDDQRPPCDLLDDLWVKEQLLDFVRETLDGA